MLMAALRLEESQRPLDLVDERSRNIGDRAGNGGLNFVRARGSEIRVRAGCGHAVNVDQMLGVVARYAERVLNRREALAKMAIVQPPRVERPTPTDDGERRIRTAPVDGHDAFAATWPGGQSDGAGHGGRR